MINLFSLRHEFYYVISYLKTFHRIIVPLFCSFGSKCLCLTFQVHFLKSPACWIIWASTGTSWPKTNICTVTPICQTLSGALFTPCPHLSLACLNLTHPSRLSSSPVSTKKSFHFAKICFQFLYLPLTLWIGWHQVTKFLQRLGPVEGRPLCRSHLLFPVTLHRQQHSFPNPPSFSHPFSRIMGLPQVCCSPTPNPAPGLKPPLSFPFLVLCDPAHQILSSRPQIPPIL